MTLPVTFKTLPFTMKLKIFPFLLPIYVKGTGCCFTEKTMSYSDRLSSVKCSVTVNLVTLIEGGKWYGNFRHRK